jgi:hypothetical protein
MRNLTRDRRIDALEITANGLQRHNMAYVNRVSPPLAGTDTILVARILAARKLRVHLANHWSVTADVGTMAAL